LKGLKAIIKNYFLTGLLVILPIFITVYVIWFLIRVMDVVLKYIPAKYLPENYLPFQIPGLGLILVIILIFAVGLLTRNLAGRRVVHFWENMVDRIPLVRIIYSGVKQLLEAFFMQKNEAFKRVALLEYPRRGTYVIGFITGESRGEVQTSGFYMLIPEDELIVLNMTVEDAFKLIISGGIFSPPEQDR